MKKALDYGFDYEDAVSRVKAGENLLGKKGVFAPLIKKFLEAGLKGFQIILILNLYII